MDLHVRAPYRSPIRSLVIGRLNELMCQIGSPVINIIGKQHKILGGITFTIYKITLFQLLDKD